jgi:alpha-glucosidase
MFLDISTSAQGYNVIVTDVVQTGLGLHIPLNAIGNSSFYGNLIRELVVDIVYETSERIHVKVR